MFCICPLLASDLSSPAVAYDPVFQSIARRTLLLLCLLFVSRLLLYGGYCAVVSRKVFGEFLSSNLARHTVDFWEVVYPAYAGGRGKQLTCIIPYYKYTFKFLLLCSVSFRIHLRVSRAPWKPSSSTGLY